MNKKVKRSLIAALALAQVSGIGLSPVTSVFAQSYSLTDSATTRLNHTKSAVATMEGNPTKDTITAAMNSFAALFGNGDSNGNLALEYDGHAKGQFTKIIQTLNKQGDASRNELSLHFFNRMGLRFGNDGMFYYDVYLTDLIDNTSDKALNSKMNHSAGALNQVLYDFDVLKPDGNGNKVTIKDGNVVLTNPQPVGQQGSSPRPQGTVDIVLEDNPEALDGMTSSLEGSWEDVYYEVVDGKYVRVTITYKEVDGKITSEVKREVVPEHEALAGTAEDWQMMNDATSERIDDVRSEGADDQGEPQMARSDFTLHYTVTKDLDNVYYFDTGIRVSHEETATYQQVKDVLYQLALRSEGYLAEDKGKFLIVVEGKPVLIREAKDKYSKEEVEELFEGFKTVDMRIMPTRIGTTASLEEQLATGTQQTVQVNGKDANLTTQPSIEDHFVILPIEEISKLLNLEVTSDRDKVSVTNGKDTLVYEKLVKAVVKNGKVEDTAVPSILTSSGVLMGDITPLNEMFGIEMIWDEEESMILLTTTAE